MRNGLAGLRIATLAVGLLTPLLAEAAELKLFVAGAAKSAVEAMLPAFEQASGDKAIVTFDTVGALRDRVLAGEAPDVVIVSEAAIKALAEKGKVAGTPVLIGRTGVGFGIKLGAPVPAIASPEALAAFLLASASIGYADPARGATAGTQFRKTIEAMQLTEKLGSKLKVFPFGVEVIAAVGRGEIAVGVSQATEILSTPGIAFAGFLPDPHQVWTVYQAAAIRDGAAAQRFLAELKSPASNAAFRQAGFTEAGR